MDKDLIIRLSREGGYMENINDKTKEFYEGFGCGKKMVLSTLQSDKVSSRMMSVVLINGIFYFQTDKTFRKYCI